MATLTRKLTAFNSAPIATQADSFELARARAERDFTLLTDGEAFKLTAVLQNEETTPRQKDIAYALLHRAMAPLALLAARDAAEKFQSFDAAHSAAEIAMWRCLNRWEPKKGMKLAAFVRLMLPVELERERKEQEIIDRSDWAEIAVKAAIHAITGAGGRNRLFLTGYSDAEGLTTTFKVAGQVPARTLRFPAHATVTYMTTTRGRLITERTPSTHEALRDVEVVKQGKKTLQQKMVPVPDPNPMLAWFTNTKVTTTKVFSAKQPRNWPRKTAKAKTGYKLSQLKDADQQFKGSVFGTKITSRLMLGKVFHKPFRPLREDDVTPRMIQDIMRRDRLEKNTPFDEKAWSVSRISTLMEELHSVTSYDATISDDEGNDTRRSEFLAAPEQDDEPIPEDEFEPEQLTDAARITERLQASGLWDLAMRLPLQKFLRAHDAGRPGFCTLCSRYGIRVKHALQIVKAIEATLR